MSPTSQQNKPKTTLAEDQLKALKELYPWDRPPEYFAGGHDWSDGTIYLYKYRNEDRLLKLMPKKQGISLERVAERQAFQEFLNLRGVDTVSPVRSEAGKLAEAVECGTGKYVVYAWSMLPGEHVRLVDPRDCGCFYRRWGTMLGKLHRLAKEWPHWRHSECRDSKGDPLISRDREWRHFFHRIPNAGVRAAWERMKSDLDALPVTRDNHGFLHNDAHPKNIISAGNNLILIDFDVANYLWFMVDLAICVYSEYSRVNFHSPYSRRNEELNSIFITPFMQAYASENCLPGEEYSRVELFLNYRRFLMYACFYDQIRDNNPGYLATMEKNMIQGQRYLAPRNWFTDYKP